MCHPNSPRVYLILNIISLCCPDKAENTDSGEKKNTPQKNRMKMIYLNCSHFHSLFVVWMCSLAWINFACIEFPVVAWYFKCAQVTTNLSVII